MCTFNKKNDEGATSFGGDSSLASCKAYAGPFRRTTELKGAGAFPGDSRLNAKTQTFLSCWVGNEK